MYIQSRVYKFNSSKKEVQDKITRLSNHSFLKAGWIDENNFFVQKKSSPFVKLVGNLEETETFNKLKIAISTDNRYLLVYLLPLAVVIYGIVKWTDNSEKGIVLVLAGISLSGFIFLIASAIIGGLKKNFKEEFQIM